jgi:hypothetical protein
MSASSGLTHTSAELFWTMSLFGPCCRTVGCGVFGGSLKGKACVGYAACVVFAHSGSLLGVRGQGQCAKQWLASPNKRWVFGVRLRTIRPIDLLVSSGSWLQTGSREREMATGNASIVAVMGKKDNAGACPVGHGEAVEGYGTPHPGLHLGRGTACRAPTSAWVHLLSGRDLTTCWSD